MSCFLFFFLPVDSLGQWKHAGTQIIKIKESLLAGMYMLLLCCFVCVSVCTRVHLFPKAFYDLTLGGHKTNGWIKRKKKSASHQSDPLLSDLRSSFFQKLPVWLTAEGRNCPVIQEIRKQPRDEERRVCQASRPPETEIILGVQPSADGWTHSFYCFFCPLIIPLWAHSICCRNTVCDTPAWPPRGPCFHNFA